MLLKVLGDGQLFSWKAIIAALQATTPHDIKRARQVLKGLIRQGEVVELEGRKYALVSSQAVEDLKGRLTMPPPRKIRSAVS